MSYELIAFYAETLEELSPGALDHGCKHAPKKSQGFPKPAHIYEAAQSYRPANDRSEFMGPALVWDTSLEKERLERQRQFDREVAEGKATPLSTEKHIPIPARPPFKVMTSTMSLEEQKEELRKRGFIA